MKVQVETLKDFASTIHKLLRSDRDAFVGIAGFTGEGKSCFSTQLQKAYSEVSGTAWSYENNLTWQRTELLTWIDGKSETDKEGQVPEYTAVLPDELISMFFRRNWYKDDQKEAVELFNKCRDRHLFVAGNVPDFWDLDGGIQKRIRFYVYIPERGRAWIFEQENNPFATDKWNTLENKKLFRKRKNPYSCPNFLAEIHFPDWTPEEKKRYYAIRNKKRRGTEGQNKEKEYIKDSAVRSQRNILIRYLLKHVKLSTTEVADMVDLSRDAVLKIQKGIR